MTRSIRGSLGRFLAILGIVALGCGFYAGLRMTGPDMRIAADAFYDGTHLYDIKVISTLGLSKSNVDSIAATDGVEAVMPGYATDVMATLNDEQYAMRISSLPVDAAVGSDTSDGCDAISDDGNYLNRLILAQGNWPTAEGECVLSADRVMGTPIQIGDTVQVLYGTEELDGVLDVRTYTVVGLVHSSAFVSSVGLGSTTLGSGTIQQYMYVAPENFADDLPYTEAYVRVAGAADRFSGSDAYQATVDEVSERLKDDSGALASARLAEVKADAQEKLDSKKADYESEKADAYAELDDAARKLEEAAQTIADSQQQIDDGAAELESGKSELEEKRAQAQEALQSAYDTLVSTQSQLDDASAQIADGQAQLASAWQQYRDSLAQWQTQSDAWETKRAELLQTLSDTQAKLATLQSQQAAIEQQMAGLDPSSAAYAALAEQLAQVKAGIASVQEGIAELAGGIETGDRQIAEAKATLDAAKATLDEQQGTLDAKAAQVADGRSQLEAGWASYTEQKEQAQTQLDAAQETIDESSTKLDDARSQLESGKQEYADNLATYENGRREADERFDDAATQIANAQRDIDDIATPSVYVLDRTKNYGSESFRSDSERIDNIAAVFPFIFFLVAALVALTTMTRMVDEERELIGTYKALGYSKARITSKYLSYAGIASAVGAALGILILSQVLPFVICRAYAIIYNVPQRPLPLVIDIPLALLSAGMGIGITLVATWAAAAATLHERPAQLMLPRAPKAGKRILLEHIGPLWRHFSFSWKVTCRNLFRYRKRLWMTIFGIAGCTALLLTGFGLHDAIWDIIDKQFGPVVSYDVIVQLADDAAESDVSAAMQVLDDQGDATSIARADAENMRAGTKTQADWSIQAVVPQDADTFTALVNMHERTTRTAIPFDDNSVVVTEKLGYELDIGVGDTITIYDLNDVGDATGEGFDLTVTGIMENYVSNYVYVGKDAYRSACGKEPNYRDLYAIVTTDTAARETLDSSLHDLGCVETVAYNDETIDSYRKMLSSVNMIVVVLVVAAAALAFIVLYNLTNININERKREIASLKVLGFTPHEVDAYIFREIALLTVFGAAFGLVFGIFLESFVVQTAEVDYVMFGRDIHALSFLFSFALTLGFSALVMFAMRRKLDDINMVESLKSNE